MTGRDAVAGAPPNPFVGPRPIEKGQPIFGRDLEIAQLYDLLCAERVVLLHSPSGAGKSSIIQAGLIPRLAELFDVWRPVRVNLPLPSGSAAGINRFVRSCNLGFEAGVPKRLQRDQDAISEMTLAAYVAGRPQRPSAPRNIVLIFDQFEEALTVDPLGFEAKRGFFAELGKLLQDNPHIWALFAIREDYIAPFDPYTEQLPTHLRNRFRLDLLGRNAAADVICNTVESGGRRFAPQALARLVADLATMQVQQPGGEFKSQPGPYIEPLQLQVACRSLWQRMAPDCSVIEEADLDSFGDVTRALAEYYECEVAKVAGANELAERSIREWCGGKLVTRGNIRGQVLREEKQSGGLDNVLIQRLIDTHLVRGEQRAGTTWYELSHDRLVEPILRDNERWFAAHLAKVQLRALQWNSEGEPESLLVTGSELREGQHWATQQADYLTGVERRFLAASRKKQRRLTQVRAVVAILIAFLLVTSALGVIATRERDRAESNLDLARQAVDESLSSAGRQQARESGDSPDMEAFRKVLLEKAAAFYGIFTRENSGNLKLREEAGWAHSRLGDVNRLLERRDEAVKQYNQAIAVFSALASQYPHVVRYRQALAYCHNFLGETIWAARSSARKGLQQSEKPDPSVVSEARSHYDEALRLQSQIHGSEPANTDDIQELARSYYNRGILSADESDRSGSEADFRAAATLLEPIANVSTKQNGNSTSPDPAQELARVDHDLATLEQEEGRSPEAKALYEKAIWIAEQLTIRNPQEREYQAELALYCDGEARLLVDLNDPGGAERRNRQSLDLVEALASAAPALSEEQAKILQLHSEILLAQRSPEALDASENERELLEKLVRSETPERHLLFQTMFKNLAVNYLDLAEWALHDGDLKDAQVSVKSLGRVLSRLSVDDREAALENYRDLQRRLQLKLSKHN
jgi:tetratricopeptide (TPR) repeat protein